MDLSPAGLPLAELSRWILMLVPGVLLSPQAPFFLLVVLLVALQYRRVAAVDAALFGRPRRSPLRLTASAVVYGMAGGILGSYIMVLVGIVFSGDDLRWIWPLALLLALLHPRFLCFSYAGGLVSLAALAFGRPDVNVPGIVGLVGALHIVEGVLVLLSGDDAAIPVSVRHRSGRVVGGFMIQRFWPVPVMALFLAAIPEPLRAGALEMPDWWPLIRPAELAGIPDLDVLMLPVAAALGYADLALTEPPEARSRRSGLILIAYSLALLVLAWLGSREPALLWLAAVATPGLHEWMIQAGRRHELRGTPRFAAPPRGVLLFDVLPGGLADELGLRRGDVIVAVNGLPVNGREELAEALRQASWYVEFEVLRDGEPLRVEHRRFRFAPGVLGVLTAPEPGDQPQVDLEVAGPVAVWARRLLARIRGAGR